MITTHSYFVKSATHGAIHTDVIEMVAQGRGMIFMRATNFSKNYSVSWDEEGKFNEDIWVYERATEKTTALRKNVNPDNATIIHFNFPILSETGKWIHNVGTRGYDTFVSSFWLVNSQKTTGTVDKNSSDDLPDPVFAQQPDHPDHKKLAEIIKNLSKFEELSRDYEYDAWNGEFKIDTDD